MCLALPAFHVLWQRWVTNWSGISPNLRLHHNLHRLLFAAVISVMGDHVAECPVIASSFCSLLTHPSPARTLLAQGVHACQRSPPFGGIGAGVSMCIGTAGVGESLGIRGVSWSGWEWEPDHLFFSSAWLLAGLQCKGIVEAGNVCRKELG